MTYTRREPIFGAAVLKLTWLSRREEQSDGFKEIYEGVLRDLGLTDEEVDRYLAAHEDDVQKAMRGGKG